jgi:MerR family transcriptional regulator, copper efflux regulator
MSNQGFNINEAAKKLNVSTRTIRRHIKAGKIKAELIKGSFGDEYRILELPPQFDPNAGDDEEEEEQALDIQSPFYGGVQGIELIRELQEKNLALAAQLGAAAERIRGMESQLKLLAPPPSVKMVKQPWWRKFQSFFLRTGQPKTESSTGAQATEEKD